MKSYVLAVIILFFAAFTINGCDEAVKVEKTDVIKQTAEPNNAVMAEKEADVPVPPPPAEPAEANKPQELLKPVEPNIVEEQPKAEVKSEPNKPSEPNIPETASMPAVEVKIDADVNKVKSSQNLFLEKYGELIKNYVAANGAVNYEVLKRKKIELITMLDSLRNFDANEYAVFSKEAKTAFWINVYNLKMLNILTDNYPIQSSAIGRLWYPPNSLRLIEPMNVVGTAKWDKYKFIVMNEEFTLSEIEKRFFLKEFNDPRIIFALNFGSVGCPQFRNEPYTSDKLNEQLDEQIKKYLATPMGLIIDDKDQSVELTGLLQDSWYGNYFIEAYGTDKKFKMQEPKIRTILNFVSKYIDVNTLNFLEKEVYSVTFIPYDWRLNEPSSIR